MGRSIHRRSRQVAGAVNPWVDRALGWASPRPTNIERLMARALDDADVRYAQFVRIGPYEADFVLPEQILWSRRIGPAVIECDGDFWHKGRQDKDARKDRYLRACGYKVYRFGEMEIKRDVQSLVMVVVG